MQEQNEDRAPRAFISYTWDSEDHKEKIRGVSDLLRDEGVDSNIDQYEISPPEGWTHWAINQVEESDYVLIVITENYKSLSNKKVSSVANRDFVWQADLVINLLYQLGNRNEGGKFIPVVFNEADKTFIPVQLSQYTSYNMDEKENPKGFETLFKHILQQSNKPNIKLRSKKSYTKICPYRGLAPFREEDAQYFYGRERFISKLIKEVKEKSAVGVIGPSGSGKSSVIYAGLFPYYREKENAIIIKTRPGTDPLSLFARSLAETRAEIKNVSLSDSDKDQKTADIRNEIENGEETVSSLIQKLGKETNRTVLIFIDQFEEIFTIAQPKQTEIFLNSLTDLAQKLNQEKDNSCKIIFTMRIGFLGTALGHPQASKLFTDDEKTDAYIKKLIIGPMSPEELTSSIEKPALETGLNIEKGLSELITTAVGQEPGFLPLLEFCLLELWKKQDEVNRGVLTIDDYQEIGGVKGALVKHANEVYENLTETEKLKAKKIFVQLVNPGLNEQDTRRIASLTTDIGKENFGLLKRFADERLIVANKSKARPGDVDVEVIHEALIREWGLFQGWINADREFRVWQEKLRTSVTDWETSKQEDGLLLRGSNLISASEWYTKKKQELPERESRFIIASQTRAKKLKRKLWSGGILVSALILSFGVFGTVNYYNARVMAEKVAKGFNLTKEELFDASDLDRWTPYQGLSNWEDAKKICKDLGMRLPKRGEWQMNFAVHKKVLNEEEWSKFGPDYWTSEDYSETNAFVFTVTAGYVSYFYKDYAANVRCIR